MTGDPSKIRQASIYRLSIWQIRDFDRRLNNKQMTGQSKTNLEMAYQSSDELWLFSTLPLSRSKIKNLFFSKFLIQSVINKEKIWGRWHEWDIGKYRNAFNKLFNKIYAFFSLIKCFSRRNQPPRRNVPAIWTSESS